MTDVFRLIQQSGVSDDRQQIGRGRHIFVTRKRARFWTHNRPTRLILSGIRNADVPVSGRVIKL